MRTSSVRPARRPRRSPTVIVSLSMSCLLGLFVPAQYHEAAIMGDRADVCVGLDQIGVASTERTSVGYRIFASLARLLPVVIRQRPGTRPDPVDALKLALPPVTREHGPGDVVAVKTFGGSLVR